MTSLITKYVINIDETYIMQSKLIDLIPCSVNTIYWIKIYKKLYRGIQFKLIHSFKFSLVCIYACRKNKIINSLNVKFYLIIFFKFHVLIEAAHIIPGEEMALPRLHIAAKLL